MFRQLFSILLVSSLIGPYLGISLYLKHEKRMLKREIKHRIIEGIDKSELVELTFALADAETQLRWEHSKEFEYNGEMYDVVESKSENGKITYWCWWDNEETTLNKQLNKLLARALNDQSPSNGNANAQFWLNLIFLIPDQPAQIFYALMKTEKSLFSFQHDLSGVIITGDSPPPKV
jgi:hypothetical protein